VDGQRVTLPVALAGGRLGVRVNSAYALLQTDLGLRVRHDGTQRVEVQVPSSYAGWLYGLCGNYNGQSADDNLTPYGTSGALGARTPGFSPGLWEVSGAWEPGCLGSISRIKTKEIPRPKSLGLWLMICVGKSWLYPWGGDPGSPAALPQRWAHLSAGRGVC
ncbi:unnamed protein product, partial [Eretmochelys imbricata]